MRVKEITVGRDRKDGDYIQVYFFPCILDHTQQSPFSPKKIPEVIIINLHSLWVSTPCQPYYLLYPQGIEDGDTQENKRVRLLSKY